MEPQNTASESQQSPLRNLPSVNRILEAPAVAPLRATVPLNLITESARFVLQEVRNALREDRSAPAPTPASEDALIARVITEAYRRMEPSLQTAINATGIVLHTGLGRARIALAARDAILAVAESHSLVEIERESGKRGSRRDHVRGLLRELTGAEDATVVNNCAGAVFLAVSTLAVGREVIISRGELVEIGGAFRMPDIIRSSGATLVEVGTTNRTRLSDYENAITERTGLILRCHPSNFAIIGFTEETPTTELVALGKKYGLPVMDDQGSGALISPETLGIAGMKGSLSESVLAGSDVVAASGDKLLGGPQAGLILGRRASIDRIVRHPLARALRVDKFTLAALEATLRLYRDPERALREIPTLRYLTRTEAELRGMANRLRARIRATLPPEQFIVTLKPERSQVGGGSLPGESLPTVCVSVRSRTGAPSPDALMEMLRRHTPPVFARIKEDAVLFDPRTVEIAELAVISDAVLRFVGSP